MMRFDELTENNLFLYAAKHYYNPNFSDIEEFYEDLKRFKYIKRLVNRYLDNNELSERLILNHLIILQNVFGASCSSRMLFFKIDKELFPQLKTFLVYLNYLPDTIPEVKVDEIPLDATIITQLRKI